MPILSAITSGLGIVGASRPGAVAQALAWIDRLTRSTQLPATAAAPIVIAELDRLESEVARLTRERAVVTAENQLLNEILSGTATIGAARLLRRLVPQPASGVAALLDVSQPLPVILSNRGTLHPAETSIAAVTESLEWLRRESLVIHALNGATGDSPSELFLIPIKLDDKLIAVLATTMLWPSGLRPAEQAEILGRLGLSVACRFRQERELEQHQQQLWQSRQMLRLKSLTDRATDKPLETLGQYLTGVCTATEMDRAVLYLESRRATDDVRAVVEAGIALPPTVASTWKAHENRLAALSQDLPRANWYSRSKLDSIGIPSLWGQAIAWPLRMDGRRLGTLIASRIDANVISSQNRNLLDWSADVLAETLRRIYCDALVKRQARHDGLTDLANRRTFDAILTGEVDRVRLGLSEECSLLLADLDRFKSINDRYGHQAGDEVLRSTAQLLREHVGRMRIGERSLLARYGGEELAILLPGVNLAGALRIAEEIRRAIELKVVDAGDHQLKITTSIGVASCPLDGLGADNLVAAADAALYRAKSEGRNRVCRP